MRIRVVVPVYNEEVLLPGFLRHYGEFADSIVVWDNGSTDATREIAAAHPLVDLRSFQTDSYDELSVLGVLAKTKKESEGDFDWCIFPDCDEIMTARDGGAVRPILEESSADVLVPEGYELMQEKGEAPFAPEKPWVPQRGFGHRSDLYCKPIIMRPAAPVTFWAGKHKLAVGYVETRKEPRLVLLHFEMADYELWVYRKRRRPLSAQNIRNGWCVDRFCRGMEFYRQYWREKATQSRRLEADVPVLGGAH
jgi:glycosyltransferase involved in cell wall biosynthesis